MVSKLEVYKLLKVVRADYVAMARERHSLKRPKPVKPFDETRSPLVIEMDNTLFRMRDDLLSLYPEKMIT